MLWHHFSDNVSANVEARWVKAKAEEEEEATYTNNIWRHFFSSWWSKQRNRRPTKQWVSVPGWASLSVKQLGSCSSGCSGSGNSLVLVRSACWWPPKFPGALATSLGPIWCDTRRATTARRERQSQEDVGRKVMGSKREDFFLMKSPIKKLPSKSC